MLTELARQYQSKAQEGESARTRAMALLDAYYHGCAYDFLPRAWHEDIDSTGQPVPFRSRRPSTVLPIPRVIVDVFNRALWGAGRRPKATLADGGPDDNALLDDIIAEARLFRAMAEATRRALAIGTGLCVWRLQGGRLAAEAWDAKHAAPTFRPGRFPELERLDYRFKYTRELSDGRGGVKPVAYWHREVIDGKSWTVYQDVEVSAASEPEWREDSALSVEHGLGFLPAVWFPIGERGAHDFDGTGVFAPYLGLIDELNYTASQMGRALYYNLDPQTVLSGVADGDIDALLKGGRNTWCLPERAEAKLLESSGSYIEQAATRLDVLRKSIFDAAGIVLPDPERVRGAQSGTSLELLAAPQIARVDALREDVGDAFVRLLEQVLLALTSPGLAPDKARIDVRDGKPRPAAKLGRVVLQWGPHFPLTPTDAQTAATAVERAAAVGIVSKAAAARYLAPFLGVADVEADQEQVSREQAREDARERVMERWRQRAGFDDPDATGADELDEDEDAA